MVHYSQPPAPSGRHLHRLWPGSRQCWRADQDYPGRRDSDGKKMTQRAERGSGGYGRRAASYVSAFSLRCISVLSVLSVLSVVPLHAQFFAFGQNKVQYRKLDWKIIRGSHVDLYYYPAEAELAPAALAYAEASYDTLSLQFGHEVGARIPLIVYASHTDFEQTN